jgi:16S rRNA (guanine527-N7)-methyltransferase
VSGPRTRLARGAVALQLDLPDDVLDRLFGFAALLARWNRVYNLTGTDDLDQLVTRHLLDSLAVLPYLGGTRLIDVGTGAGLPGVPLAIARPGLAVTLLDASAKRLRFVRQAVIELDLECVEVVHARVADYRPQQRFDRVVTRAFAGLSDMLTACRHLVADDGQVLAMKGPRAAVELADLPPGYRLLEAVPLHVPGLEATRQLLRIAPVGPKAGPADQPS